MTTKNRKNAINNQKLKILFKINELNQNQQKNTIIISHPEDVTKVQYNALTLISQNLAQLEGCSELRQSESRDYTVALFYFYQ